MTIGRLAGAVVVAIAVIALVALHGDDGQSGPQVVGVALEGATDASETATGFLVGRDRVVTVAHVLRRDRRLVIRPAAGEAPRTGHIVRVDRRDDLALVAVPGLGGPDSAPALHPRSDEVVRIVATGRAIAAGVVRAIRANVRGPGWGPYPRPALELRARVRLGDSGAPVVDGNGRVAGVVFARASSGAATAYAVDAAALARFIFR